MSPISSSARAWTLLCLMACSASGTDPQDPGPTTLQLTGARLTLVPGLSTQLTWVVKDSKGQVLTNVPVTFTVAPPGVASVSSTGELLGVMPGSGTVTASAGKASAQLTVTVQEGGVVGPSGATLTASNGEVQLVVPAGAVTAPTPVMFGTMPNPLLDPTAVRGNVHLVTIEGASLSTPATLRLRYSAGNAPYGLPAEAIRIRSFDGAAWIAVPGGSSDPVNTVAAAPIGAGGTFSTGWVPPAQPCLAPEYRQFDFWLGAWTVTENGQPNGQNDITAVVGGCAILEHYRSLGGGVGRSISFYEPATQLWYQTYVDNANSLLKISGTFQGAAMRMFTAPIGSVVDRWSWLIEGAAVRQLAERSNNGGTSYGAPNWNGLYSRR